jgi:multiple sugar transport system ATP-binding protein
VGAPVTVGVRPEHLSIVDPAHSMLVGEVQIAEHLGGETFLYVALASGEVVVVEVQGQIAARSGERVGVDLDVAACHIFAADGRVLECGSSGLKHSVATDRAATAGRTDSSAAMRAADR